MLSLGSRQPLSVLKPFQEAAKHLINMVDNKSSKMRKKREGFPDHWSLIIYSANENGTTSHTCLLDGNALYQYAMADLTGIDYQKDYALILLGRTTSPRIQILQDIESTPVPFAADEDGELTWIKDATRAVLPFLMGDLIDQQPNSDTNSRPVVEFNIDRLFDGAYEWAEQNWTSGYGVGKNTSWEKIDKVKPRKKSTGPFSKMMDKTVYGYAAGGGPGIGLS